MFAIFFSTNEVFLRGYVNDFIRSSDWCPLEGGYIAHHLLDNTTLEEDICRCDTYFAVGPYCDRWNGANFEYCFLRRTLLTQYCPGAKETKWNPGTYFTADKRLCNRTERKVLALLVIIAKTLCLKAIK